MKNTIIKLILIFSCFQASGQIYKQQMYSIDNSTNDQLTEKVYLWISGYARDSKIKRLKAETASESFVINDWKSIDNNKNLVFNNSARYRAFTFQFVVHIKIKDYKVLMTIRDVVYKVQGLEKQGYFKFEKDDHVRLDQQGYEQVSIWLDDYFKSEFFESLQTKLNEPNPIPTDW